MRLLSWTFALVCAVALAAPVLDAQVPAPKKRPTAKAPAVAAPKTDPAPPPEAPPPPPPATDVRLTTALTQGAQVSQTTTYMRGPRQRIEFPGVVSIDQCDAKRSLLVNTAAKRYRVQAYPEPRPVPAPTDMQAMQQMMPGMPGGQPRGGVVTITTTVTDTLERQSLFGLEARHVKTTVVKQASGNACDKTPMKVEIDGWYVDLPDQGSCAHPAAESTPPQSEGSACVDHVEQRTVGDVKPGVAVKAITTTTVGEGEKALVSTQASEVTSLEITRLDAALFDIPAGYVEATSAAEIVPGIAQGGSLADALFGSTADGTSTAAPKRPGVIRVGVLEPINKSSRQLPAGQLRLDLVAKFSKGPFEALPVAGTSPEAIESTAARLECDYLLLTEITEVKASKPGKLGSMMKMGSGAPPKDVYDVKLDYRLFAANATSAPKFTGSAKGSSGGGFGLGSALRLAAFAGQMYMGMGMMGGMGGMGLMGSLNMMNSVVTPMMTMNSTPSTGGMPGMGGMLGGDPSDADVRDTVSEAFDSEAKSAMDQIKKK
jgi:hypothetical protein